MWVVTFVPVHLCVVEVERFADYNFVHILIIRFFFFFFFGYKSYLTYFGSVSVTTQTYISEKAKFCVQWFVRVEMKSPPHSFILFRSSCEIFLISNYIKCQKYFSF